MTNTVPAVSILATVTMSARRPIAPAQSSYAAVLSGQARHSQHSSSDPTPPWHGVDTPQQLAIVPSYLAESSYAERLASRSSSAHPQAFDTYNVPLSSMTSTSGRKPQSQRGGGVVFETVQSNGPDLVNQLPSRLNEDDKSPSIELSCSGTEAGFVGASKVNDSEAAAIRADKPMPAQCGVFYYETTIISGGKEGSIGIGFCTKKVSLNKLPGWEQESWGYHGDDGASFCCSGARKSYGPKFSKDDIIGCGVNFRTRTAFFTRNGHNLGVAFKDINKTKIYPVVGMKKAGENVRVNFGQKRFVYDIDHYMKMEKAQTYEDIHQYPVNRLCPPLDESALIQALVSQYLSHDGFVDTARTFAQDVQNELKALNSGLGRPGFCLLDSKGDIDAVQRQKIRNAILEGDVEHALKYTNAYYPSVLKDNELLYFRLRRRKLVEMIRGVAETVHENNNWNVKNNNQNGTVHDFDHDMDIDDPMNGGGSEWDGMDMEDEEMNNIKAANVKNALDAAVEYGQRLRVDFSSDTRPEIRKPLEEAFSLLAYTDPKTSVLAHLLDEDGRISDAEELNSAILVSLGKSSAAALERLVKQLTVLLQDMSEDGGPGAFVNLRNDFLKDNGAVC